MLNEIKIIIDNAILEDLPNGDITTDTLISENAVSDGEFIAKEDGIISGIEVCKLVFSKFEGIEYHPLKLDGDFVNSGEVIAAIHGKSKSILKSERIALNIMQRMSGIATKTNSYVQEIKQYNSKILDTRKTTPNFRILEKQAVVDGGGTNHRFNLSEMAMIKDNHIKAAGSIKKAVQRLKKHQINVKIEVEVDTISLFKEALNEDIDIIMLDNMNIEDMKICVNLNNGKFLEASGNVTLAKLPAIAATGVDYISVGALTHSYNSLDISLKFK